MRAQGKINAIANELKGFGGILRCMHCEEEQELPDIAESLQRGWPRCCGYTMRWITQRQLDEAAKGNYHNTFTIGIESKK